MNSAPKNKPRKQGKLVVAGLAVLAIGALIVQATLSPIDIGSGSADESLHGSMDPTDTLSGLVLGNDDTGGAITDAAGTVDAALLDQQAQLQMTIDAALAELEYVTGSYAGFVPVPSDFDGTISTIPLPALPYDVPLLETTLALQAMLGTAWHAIPSEIPMRESVMNQIPPEAMSELQTVMAEVEALLSDPQIQALLAEIETVTGPLPLPGQAPDAEGAADPHEEGALAALDHADALLEEADAVYGILQAEVDKVMDLHEDVAGQVRATIDDATETVLQAEADIMAQAATRIADLTALLEESIEAYQEQLAAYEALVDEAVQTAVADIQAALDAQVAAIEGVADAQVDALLATAHGARADAEQRVASLLVQADGMIRDLREAGEEESIDEVLEAVQSMRADIESQADATIAQIDETIAQIRSEVDAQIASLQATVLAAQPRIAAVSTEVIGEAQARLDYAIAFVEATTQAAIEENLALAQHTVWALQERLLAESEQLIDEVTVAVERTYDVLDAGLAMTDVILEDASTMVQDDMAYILKVAEDYAAVPVGSRADRAEHWNGVHALLGGDLGGAQLVAMAVASDVEQALVLTQQNLDDLARLTA